jgi:hypothetical protein
MDGLDHMYKMFCNSMSSGTTPRSFVAAGISFGVLFIFFLLSVANDRGDGRNTALHSIAYYRLFFCFVLLCLVCWIMFVGR